MKKKGFTLIELLAVIVILAIIALIVTPVITGIIRSARDAADKRSAEAYVKAGENFFTSTLLSVENYALLGTNVIDKLDVSHNPATGSIIVDALGNVEMAIVIRDKCYKKVKTASIGEITVDEDVDNCTLTAVAYTPERCFEYELDPDNNATITGYLCGSTGYNKGAEDFYRNGSNHDGEFNDVYIPPTLGGYNVISIGEYAFRAHYNFIDSVVIPEGVTTLGNYAFSYNTLNKVFFPSTLLEIGAQAFDHNSLSEIVIPDGVINIGSGAFRRNDITNLNIGNSVEYIAEAAFASNDLTSVTIPDSVISIGDEAFYYNSIQELTLGNNVQYILDGAFYDNKLANITIPDSVISIGNDAFAGNYISKLNIGNSVEYIGYSAFAWNQLTSVTIPDSVEIIDEYAFYTNAVSELTLGTGVKTIMDNAFATNKIISVTIPNSVTEIGKKAFSYNNISELTLGNGIDSLKYGVFTSNKLTSVTIPNNVITIDEYVFDKNPDLTSITIDNYPDSIEGAPWRAINASVTYLRGVHVNIDSSLTGITTEKLQVLDNATITFESTELFKIITSVTIDGVKYSGNTFTVGTKDINVTAYTYEETLTETIESAHNYANNMTGETHGVDLWEHDDPTVTSYTITFDEYTSIQSDDVIYIYDSSGSMQLAIVSTFYAGATRTIYNTTGFKIVFVSDKSGNAYGFKATITKNRE